MLILHLTGLSKSLVRLLPVFIKRETSAVRDAGAVEDDGEERFTARGAAVYVDVENLGAAAQEVISQVVDDLSAEDGCRTPTSLSLYVRADKLELWRIWADGKWPQIHLRVRGVQHFSNGSRSKNSADLAITADATEDFALGRTSLVAVVSNDSDFGALFVKIHEMSIQGNYERTPFLWVTSERGGALSPEVRRFVPDEFRWQLPPTCSDQPIRSDVDRRLSGTAGEKARPEGPSPREQIARTIVRHMPVGEFKASDARKIISHHMPDASAPKDDARFGQFLLNEIAPLLENLGVTVNRDQKSTKRYTITAESKRRIR